MEASVEIFHGAFRCLFRQCEKFPSACCLALLLSLYVQERGLPPWVTHSATDPALLECLAFLLPIVAVLGAVATGEFCDWARAQVGDLAKQLDHRAGISVDWRLQPPELACAYEKWCRRQPYRRVFPWMPVGVYLLHCLIKLPSTSEVPCGVFQASLCAGCAIHVLKAVMDNRLSPFVHAALQAAAVALRGTVSVVLSLQQDQCILSLGADFFESRSGLLIFTAATILVFCTLSCVPMEYTFSIYSLTLAVQCVILCLRFHVRPPVTHLSLADIDWWAVMGVLMVTITAGQAALVVRYWGGISNMRCFLRAHRVAPLQDEQQVGRQHHD